MQRLNRKLKRNMKRNACAQEEYDDETYNPYKYGLCISNLLAR